MHTDLRPLIRELENLHREMLNLVKENSSVLDQVHPDNRCSATNLLHYLALRRHDVRELQERLAALGLSSLGRTESHALDSLQAVMTILHRLHHGQAPKRAEVEFGCDRNEGRRLLDRNTELLLGPPPEGRNVRIMVTMPSEASTNYDLVRDLLQSGMNCMRINCAHDGEETWAGMIRNLRRAEKELGKSCKVEMDVAGPKLRTGPVADGPAVVKFRPKRDAFGRPEQPAVIWLTPVRHAEPCPVAEGVCIPVSDRWVSSLGVGDVIRFTDTRGAKRTMTVTEVAGNSRRAESDRTGYIAPGTILTAIYQDKDKKRLRGRVAKIPAEQQALSLQIGDTLMLTRSLEPGQPARVEEASVTPARIGVTLPEFFDCVEAGQPIWLDDGKIGGTITSVSADEVAMEITHTKSGGEKLRAEKGINLPETKLTAASLSEDDRKALKFIVKNADILGYSFVRTEEDVRLLQTHLADLDATDLSIVLKIETREGFDNLPGLLMAALSSPSVGVMIARGDLAIECGYQRMAEAQEEILWISEAAHVPVVWATQVLETLAKTGTPSRSEITDAAMGERAECVMLNKGPYIVKAVQTLDDIMHRMQDHQEKKRSMLRKLGVAEGFSGEDQPPPP